MSGELRVVHLVRTGEPVASLARFLAGYRAHPAGAEHRLTILYKGFGGDARALEVYREVAAGLDHDELEVSDDGFDLTAYRSAAGQLAGGRYCFLNSHSEPVVDGWLLALDAALAPEGVGIAGATGSWASHASLARVLVHLPSPYKRLLGSPADVAEVIREMEQDSGTDAGEKPAPARRSLPQRATEALRALPQTVRLIRSVDDFPAYHLRTNSFLIDHALLVELEGFALPTKLDAHLLESGKNSVTQQVQARGLRAVVVDRAGRSWEREQWAGSETFWQAAQRGLLVADNQTRAFACGDARRRTLLSRCAWGELAAPDPVT
jgi:hypothetical protein